MKKIYLTMFTAASIISLAQNSSKGALLSSSNFHPLNGPNPNVIHPPVNPNAIGDTVWLFDGYNSYDYNGTLPSTYNVNLEDLDGLTIHSTLQASFGSTGDYKFFYMIDSTSNLHYNHPDSVFYAEGCSWFDPAGTSDNWLEFGPVHIPANGGTLAWRHNIPDYSYRDGYQVLVNTNSINSFDFANPPIFTVADNDPTTATDTLSISGHKEWYLRTADLTAYAGQDIYIAFRHYANDMFLLALTDIMVIEGNPSGISKQKNSTFTIGQNRPNPANGSTSINYTLKENSNVAFNVTDLSGKTVYSENFSFQSVGSHNVDVNTSSFSNGMYFYNFLINGEKVTRKFIVAN